MDEPMVPVSRLRALAAEWRTPTPGPIESRDLHDVRQADFVRAACAARLDSLVSAAVNAELHRLLLHLGSTP